jgi:predicted dehydrogenase
MARKSGPRRLRVGVIGAGAFAEVCHIPGLQSHPDAEVVALCGRRQDYARSMADRLGVHDTHTDYRELCQREDIDAVTIVTPNAYHAEQAIAAFQAGKHVLCEKPLAMTVAEARAMMGAADASGKIHQVAFTFRYLHGLQELRRRVRAGEIGEPYYLRVQYDSWDHLRPGCLGSWRDRRKEAGAGVLYDVGSHLFDAARYIFGPIEAASGFLHQVPRQRPDGRSGQLTDVETDDLATAWFRHVNGSRGQWWVSRVTPPYTKNGSLEVIGTEGALRASLSRGSRDSLERSGPTEPDWKAIPLPPRAYDGEPHALPTMMQSFVDACLRGKLDGDIDASFMDGLAAQQGLAAVMTADAELRWVRLDETG